MDLTVLILTFNEEINLPYALESVKDWANQIIVVDSYSEDRTIEIAESFGAEIYQNDFNTNRVNSYKENQTPLDIVLDDMIGGYINFDDTDWINVDSIFKFKPVVVDKLTSKFLKVI